MFNGASSATQLSYRDTSSLSIAEKITTTISFVVTSATKRAGGTISKYSNKLMNDGILCSLAAVITGVQFVPGIDVAVDICLCIVSAEMYASAESEHRESVGKGKEAKRLCDRDR